MAENTRLEYGAKQMMLCSGTWGGYRDVQFPYVLLKGYWFLFWGFNPGDQVTIINLAKGLIVIQVTKTREEFAKEGWPDRHHRKNGLSYEQLIGMADNLLTNSQSFAEKVLNYTKAA